MTDATTEFFDDLGRRGHEPLLERVSGTLRFDLVRGERTDHRPRHCHQGGRRRLRRVRRGGLRRARRPRSVRRHRQRRDERDGGDCCAARSRFEAIRSCSCCSSGSFRDRRSHAIRASRRRRRGGAAHEPGARQHPRRQHVRRQRRARRHRGVADRPDRPVLLRHPLPLDVGADRRTASGSTALSTDDLQYFEARFFLVPGTGTVYVDAKLSVIRQRAVGDGFHEDAHDPQPRRASRSTSRSASRPAATSPTSSRSRTRCTKKGTYDDAGRGRAAACSATSARRFRRETAISATEPRPRSTSTGLTFTVQHRAARRLDDRPARRRGAARVGGDAPPARCPRRGGDPRPDMACSRPANGGSPTRRGVECDWEPLKATYRRSLVDLAALRFSPLIAGGRSLPAAGLPWFMTMFGRDSIFTSLQALPFAPELAATTLRVLGAVAGQPRRRLPRRGPGPHPARDALRRDDRVRGAAALALLRQRRRHAAVRGAARRVRALDRRHRRSCASSSTRRARRCTGSTQYADLHGQRLRLVPAPQRADRPGEPVLEGLLGLDLLPRRAAAGLPAGDLRAAGLRLRRQDARRPPGPPGLERPGVRRPARERRPPTSSAASTATSGSRTASTTPSRSTPTAPRSTRWPRTSATCCGAASSTSPRRRPWSRAPAGAAAVLRLGRAHAGRGRGPLQPDRLPRRHGLAVRQLVHRLGPAPLRLQGGGGADRRRHPRRGRVLRRPAAGGVRRLRPGADEVPGPVPDGVQPAGLVDGRAAAPAADDARPRTARRPPGRRPGAAGGRSAASNCSTSPAAGAASTPSGAGASTSRRSSAGARSWATRRARRGSPAGEADEDGRGSRPHHAPGDIGGGPGWARTPAKGGRAGQQSIPPRLGGRGAPAP